MMRINLIKFHIRHLSVDTKIAKGTLTMRFYEYLTNNEDKTHRNSLIIENIEKISQKATNNIHKIKLMDKSYLNGLKNQMTQEDIFGCLEYIAITYPNQILNLQFFKKSLKILLKNEEISKKNFIKLCFLVGFYKKHHPGPEYLRELLEKHLDEQLNALNRTEIAILCISTYKTSLRIKNEKLHERLVQEVLATDDDDTYMLVAFIKSLKHNQIESKEVIEKLKILIEKFDFEYSSLVHIMPYIADNGIKDLKLIGLICRKCIRTFNGKSRAKDVQKFLHSCALLDLRLKTQDLEELEALIVARLSTDEFQTHFDHFVNAVLSLWILNHHSRQLVDFLFQDPRFNVAGPATRVKLDSRMKLLETCVEIEKPKWMRHKIESSFDENRPSPQYLIKSSLELVMNSHLKDKTAIFVQQIRNLNIAGILVTENDGRKIHYEVLDKSTGLSDQKTPNGIFQLKIRLLKALKCEVRIIKVFN